MSLRRPVRINFQMPELTPTVAHFLWNVCETLAFHIWEAYNTEILDIEQEMDDNDPTFEDMAHLQDHVPDNPDDSFPNSSPQQKSATDPAEHDSF